jgi:uncharacterized repeat protein (TIGR02543 family)
MKKTLTAILTIMLAGATILATDSVAHATQAPTNFAGKYFVASHDVSGINSIYLVNPVTGSVGSPIETKDFGLGYSITALEVDGTNGIAYVNVSTAGHGAQFWKVDLNTHIWTNVFDNSYTLNMTEFAFDSLSGQLFGFASIDNYKIYAIGTNNGVIQSITRAGGNTSRGLALFTDSTSTNGTMFLGTTPAYASSETTAYTRFLMLPFMNGSQTSTIVQAGYSTGFNSPLGIDTAVAMDFTNDGSLVTFTQSDGVNGSYLETLTYAQITSIAGSRTATETPTHLNLSGANFDIAAFAIAGGTPPSNTVSYDANTGTGTETATTGAGALTVSTGTNYTRSGYTLAGWNTLANGNGTPVALGASYTPSQDETLYAQWTAIPVTTPVVVQAPVYTGPEFNAIAGRVVDSVEGGKVVLTGRRLDSVTKISLAGKVLTPTKSTESSIELNVPAGTPGSATLEITFTSGRMTWTNAFDYVDPAVVKAQAANKLPKPAAKPATKPAAKVTKAKPKAKK